MPNKLWNWLWFREEILSDPERCDQDNWDCHILGSNSPCAVDVSRYPLHVLNLGREDPAMAEFDRDIALFRSWVLDNESVDIARLEGGNWGELGLKTRKPCGLEALRHAIPGLAYEISRTLYRELEGTGYTSLLEDAGRRFILFGPLALLNRGDVRGVNFGAVQGKIDWGRSSGVALRDTGGRDPDGVRLVRLKAHRDANKDVQLALGFKREWRRGEEIIVSYIPECDDTAAGTGTDSGRGQRRKAHDDVVDSMATASGVPASAPTSGTQTGGPQKRQRKKSKKVLESEGAPPRDASTDV